MDEARVVEHYALVARDRMAHQRHRPSPTAPLEQPARYSGGYTLCAGNCKVQYQPVYCVHSKGNQTNMFEGLAAMPANTSTLTMRLAGTLALLLVLAAAGCAANSGPARAGRTATVAVQYVQFDSSTQQSINAILSNDPYAVSKIHESGMIFSPKHITSAGGFYTKV